MESLLGALEALPPLLTSRQVSGLLHLHINTVKALCRSGRLPAFKAGGVWRVRREDLLAFAGTPLQQERKQPEAELAAARDHAARLLAENRRQNTFYEAILENATAGIAVFDGEELRVRFANAAYRALLDEPFAGRNLAGLRLQDFMPFADEVGLTEVFRRVAATRQPDFAQDFELRGLARGITYWRYSLLPLIGESDVPDLLLVITEVTEQVLAGQKSEAARVRAEAMLAERDAILACMTEGVLVSDLQGNVLNLNPAARRIHGHAPTENVERSMGEFMPQFELCYLDGRPVPPDEWPLPRVLCGETFAALEMAVHNRSIGQCRIVSYGGAPVYDRDGQPILAVVTSRDVTDQREAERERDRLVAILEATPDLVSTADPEGRVWYYNRAGRELLGITGDMNLRHIGDSHPPQVLSVILNEALPAATRAGSWQGETTMLDLHGNEIPMSQVIIAHRGDQGEVEYFSTIARDMSGRKRIEDDLRRAREELEQRVQERTVELGETAARLLQANEALREQADLLNLTHDAITVHNMDGSIRFWNHGAEELYGFGGAEALGKNIHRLLRTRFPEPRDEIYNQVLTTGRWEGELQHTRRDGTCVVVASHWTLQRDAKGVPSGIMEINTDITAQARIHEQVAQERNLLRTLMDHSPDCIYVKDTESRFVTTNAEHLKIIGARSVEDVIGKTDLDLFPRELAEHYYADEREVMRTGRSLINREELVVDAQGQAHWFLASKAPLYDARGRVAGLVGVSRDITRRRQAEEELQAALEELSQREAALTASRAQLKALSQRVVDLQERERRYVADQLYNEAGQVLAALKLQLAVLARELRGSPQAAELLAGTQATLDGVMRELHQLAVRLRPASLDRLGLVRGVEAYATEFARDHDLDLDFTAVDLEGVQVPPEVETAAYRVMQDALANIAAHAAATLISMAMRYERGRLVIKIADNGVGFDVSEALREGGLGLFGMQERAEALGGRVAIASEQGRGTEVTVDVPLS